MFANFIILYSIIIRSANFIRLYSTLFLAKKLKDFSFNNFTALFSFNNFFTICNARLFFSYCISVPLHKESRALSYFLQYERLTFVLY